MTRLYRVVEKHERDDISASNAYSLPYGVEVKYFSCDRRQMQVMRKKLGGFLGCALFRTSGTFAATIPTAIYMAGEGWAVVLDGTHLPHGPVKVWKR